MSASNAALREFVLAMADDELILGHRIGEWTGYGPILEEDMALSNIAQDELGHSLIWFSLYEKLTGKTPDVMAFERAWNDFTCCRFVTYPNGDYAYTIVRQYLFDEAEQVRLRALSESSYLPIKEAAGKILREEAYHLMHTKSLVERLGDATDESHRRMQAAVDAAFPQGLGIFERLNVEDEMIAGGVFRGNASLQTEWVNRVLPVLRGASLHVAGAPTNGAMNLNVIPEFGGRKKSHTEHLQPLIDDLQSVYRLAPEAKW
jgi:ring-1,2-phenylacetyl-CoA epoxidase subunit PaaC